MSEDPSRIKFKWSDANATRTMLSSALNKVSMVIRASGGVRPCLDVTSLPTRAQEIIHAAINGTPPPPRFTPEVDMTFVMCTLVPPGYTPGAEGPEYAVTHKDLRMYAEQLNRGNVPVLLDHDTGTEDPFGFVSSAHFNEKTGELTAVLALRGPNKKTGRSSALRHVKGGYRCVSLGVYKYPLININVAVDASLCVVPARDGADLYIKESALVNASTGVEETRVRAGKMDVLTFRLNDMKVEAATLKGESKGEGQKVEKQTGDQERQRFSAEPTTVMASAGARSGAASSAPGTTASGMVQLITNTNVADDGLAVMTPAHIAARVVAKPAAGVVVAASSSDAAAAPASSATPVQAATPAPAKVVQPPAPAAAASPSTDETTPALDADAVEGALDAALNAGKAATEDVDMTSGSSASTDTEMKADGAQAVNASEEAKNAPSADAADAVAGKKTDTASEGKEAAASEATAAASEGAESTVVQAATETASAEQGNKKRRRADAFGTHVDTTKNVVEAALAAPVVVAASAPAISSKQYDALLNTAADAHKLIRQQRVTIAGLRQKLREQEQQPKIIAASSSTASMLRSSAASFGRTIDAEDGLGKLVNAIAGKVSNDTAADLASMFLFLGERARQVVGNKPTIVAASASNHHAGVGVPSAAVARRTQQDQKAARLREAIHNTMKGTHAPAAPMTVSASAASPFMPAPRPAVGTPAVLSAPTGEESYMSNLSPYWRSRLEAIKEHQPGFYGQIISNHTGKGPAFM